MTTKVTGKNKKRQRPLPGPDPALETIEVVTPGNEESPPSPSCPGRLIEGDNLATLKALLRDGLEQSAELVYIDPPFLSRADYSLSVKLNQSSTEFKRPAYSDRWSLDGYLSMLADRLPLAARLLTGTGKLVVHCDWHASHHVRLLLDEALGPENFLNEIIWHYGGRGAKAISGQFPRNHDTIFIYGKTGKARLKKLYREESMTLKEALAMGFKTDEEGRVFKTAPRGDYTDSSVEALEAEGRIYRTKNGSVRVKYFLEKRRARFIEKKLISDVWDDIPDLMHSPLSERTGYPTQKPERLLARLIEATTEPGDLVCDPFSGSGTTGVVAKGLGRRWVICEASGVGVQVSRARLIREMVNTGASNEAFTIERVVREDNETNPASRPRLSIKGPHVKKVNKGGYEVSVILKGYELNGAGDYEEDLAKELSEVAAEDFALLIDSWSVDWDYDGDIFKGAWHSVRSICKGGKGGKGGKSVDKEARVVTKKKPGRIAVRAFDVLGNETEEILGI